MSKRGYVYFGLIGDAVQVGNRLADWFADDERAYLAAFRANKRRLDWFEPGGAEVLVAEWDEGRVFSARREARWRKERGSYALWLLAEEGNLPADLDGLSAVEVGSEGWQAVERTVPTQGTYLWGQYKVQEEGWVEVRLPRLLRYPVGDERRVEDAFVRVGHLDYQAPNGAVQFMRLTEVR
jgi:hypothetical protein